MNTSQIFELTRNYSEIVGFQKKAVDLFSISQEGEKIIAIFRSANEKMIKSEKIIVKGISFEECKKVFQFIAENSVRQGSWIEIIRDYCVEHNGKIEDIIYERE